MDWTHEEMVSEKLYHVLSSCSCAHPLNCMVHGGVSRRMGRGGGRGGEGEGEEKG